jgi:3-hydroxyisobutyrate dehydrogenase
VRNSDGLRAGIIGLGVVGSGVARCLARSGHLAAVYVRRQETAELFREVAVSVTSAADLVDLCDVVLIAVMSAEQAIDVLDGREGLLSRRAPGLSVVLLATVSLEDLRLIRALTEAAGAILIDCGVIGVARAADNGIVCLVGAKQAELDRVRPVLDGFALDVVHMGGPGTGMAAKLARNVIVYTAWRGAYEAGLLGRAAGIDVARLAAAIDSTGAIPGGATTWLRNPTAGFDLDAAKGQALEMLKKDLAAALDLADELGLELPTTRLSFETASEIVGTSES